MHTTAWFKMMAVAAVLGCASVAPAPAKEAGPNPNIGKPAPELKIKDWAAGKGVTQAELKGRPYVLEFWATWCPPCRKSIPHLVELAQRVMPLGMNVIGLSDEDITKVRPFAEKNNMIYQVGVNNGMKGLEFEGIPFAAVIDKSGKVIWAGHPM